MGTQGSESGRYPRRARITLAGQALLTFVVLDLGFRLFGFARVYRLVQWWSRRYGAGQSVTWEPVVGRTLEAVAVATRYYWRRRLDCLPRALTVFLLLRRKGVPATLRIGVKRFPFAAHAWVECRESTIGESASTRKHEPYVPIIST